MGSSYKNRVILVDLKLSYPYCRQAGGQTRLGMEGEPSLLRYPEWSDTGVRDSDRTESTRLDVKPTGQAHWDEGQGD